MTLLESGPAVSVHTRSKARCSVFFFQCVHTELTHAGFRCACVGSVCQRLHRTKCMQVSMRMSWQNICTRVADAQALAACLTCNTVLVHGMRETCCMHTPPEAVCVRVHMRTKKIRVLSAIRPPSPLSIHISIFVIHTDKTGIRVCVRQRCLMCAVRTRFWWLMRGVCCRKSSRRWWNRKLDYFVALL